MLVQRVYLESPGSTSQRWASDKDTTPAPRGHAVNLVPQGCLWLEPAGKQRDWTWALWRGKELMRSLTSARELQGECCLWSGGRSEVKVLVIQSSPTLCIRQASPSIEILQAGILEWVAISYSKGSSQPRDRNRVSCIAGRLFTTEPPGKPRYCYWGWGLGC